MSAELLSWLVEGSIATSLAALLVLALRGPLRRLFGAGCIPWLWSLVPLAQLAVWLPAPMRESAASVPLLVAAGLPQPLATPAASAASGLTAGDWFALCWLLGALACAGYFLILQRRFRQRLGQLRECAPGVLLAESCELGPAVLGLLRPQIILPADFTHRFSAQQQTLILAHERSHLRRGDIVANAIASALRCLYWFNPLLHYAADRLRHDHELASDADVMQRHPHARRHYADTLLNVQLAVPGLPVGCLWQSSHPLKERILMLSSVRSTPLRRRVGVMLSSALAVSLATLAWAGQPAEKTSHTSQGTGATQLYRAAVTASIDGKTHHPELHFDPEAGFAFGIDDWFAELHYDPSTKQLISAQFQHQGKPSTAIDLGALSRGESVRIRASDAASVLTVQVSITPLAEAAASANPKPRYGRLSPPAYPVEALRNRQQGRVILNVQVKADGQVGRIEVDSSEPPRVFDAAAIEAVSNWTFEPAQAAGAPVSAWVRVPICFSLNPGTEPACSGGAEALDGIQLSAPQEAPKG